MAVSCPDINPVMYGAYYPYLYGRAGPSRPFYQYERFNQDLYSSSGVPIAASSSTSAGSHSPCSPLLPPTIAAANSTQTSSTTIPTIPSQRQHATKEEDLTVTRSDTEATLPHAHNDSSCSSGPDSPHHSANQETSSGRAQYVSATCVVVTHYAGDVASVVDDHFTRALNFGDKAASKVSEGCSPMSARNFPASFWNSNYVPPTPAPTHHQMSDLYSTDGGYSTDPWVPHAYGSYAAAHAHAAHAYHHNMAQYGSLLRLPQQYGHSSRLHHDQQTAHHALESAAAYSSYPMAGLEAQVQESSKDLYWF